MQCLKIEIWIKNIYRPHFYLNVPVGSLGCYYMTQDETNPECLSNTQHQLLVNLFVKETIFVWNKTWYMILIFLFIRWPTRKSTTTRKSWAQIKWHNWMIHRPVWFSRWVLSAFNSADHSSSLTKRISREGEDFLWLKRKQKYFL